MRFTKNLLFLAFTLMTFVLNAADFRIDSTRYEGGSCDGTLMFSIIGEFTGTDVDYTLQQEPAFSYDRVWIDVFDGNCKLIMTFNLSLLLRTETEIFLTANLPLVSIPDARPFTFVVYDSSEEDHFPTDPILQTYVDNIENYSTDCGELPLLAAPNCIAQAPIPTMSFWAALSLMFLALTIGVVYSFKQRTITSKA